jgi:hypothetical protein
MLVGMLYPLVVFYVLHEAIIKRQKTVNTLKKKGALPNHFVSKIETFLSSVPCTKLFLSYAVSSKSS